MGNEEDKEEEVAVEKLENPPPTPQFIKVLSWLKLSIVFKNWEEAINCEGEEKLRLEFIEESAELAEEDICKGEREEEEGEDGN